MKRLNSIFYGVLIVLIMVGCNGHHDDIGYALDDVEEQCDFDLTKTMYRIDVLNSGKLILMRGDYKVVDGNDNNVVGKDSCYLKLRAYNFWINSVKDDEVDTVECNAPEDVKILRLDIKGNRPNVISGSDFNTIMNRFNIVKLKMSSEGATGTMYYAGDRDKLNVFGVDLILDNGDLIEIQDGEITVNGANHYTFK